MIRGKASNLKIRSTYFSFWNLALRKNYTTNLKLVTKIKLAWACTYRNRLSWALTGHLTLFQSGKLAPLSFFHSKSRLMKTNSKLKAKSKKLSKISVIFLAPLCHQFPFSKKILKITKFIAEGRHNSVSQMIIILRVGRNLTQYWSPRHQPPR